METQFSEKINGLSGLCDCGIFSFSFFFFFGLILVVRDDGMGGRDWSKRSPEEVIMKRFGCRRQEALMGNAPHG